MALQEIDTGAAANDGTGEPRRTAMVKINENFAVLDTVFNVKDPRKVKKLMRLCTLEC